MEISNVSLNTIITTLLGKLENCKVECKDGKLTIIDLKETTDEETVLIPEETLDTKSEEPEKIEEVDETKAESSEEENIKKEDEKTTKYIEQLLGLGDNDYSVAKSAFKEMVQSCNSIGDLRGLIFEVSMLGNIIQNDVMDALIGLDSDSYTDEELNFAKSKVLQSMG